MRFSTHRIHTHYNRGWQLTTHRPDTACEEVQSSAGDKLVWNYALLSIAPKVFPSTTKLAALPRPC